MIVLTKAFGLTPKAFDNSDLLQDNNLGRTELKQSEAKTKNSRSEKSEE